MSVDEKELSVRQVAELCKVLATRKRDRICGVDGNEMPENWIAPYDCKEFSPEELLGYSKDIGMKCDTFMLTHCDLGPSNILVDLANNCQVGVIDWEMAGFMPREWLRTKFWVCGAMNLGLDCTDETLRTEYRKMIDYKLAKEGFSHVVEQWWDRYFELYPEDRV